LLGPPRIELDGRAIQIARRKATALLAYLAVTRHSHRRDTLATLLWPEQDQRSARAGLRRALAELKAELGGEWLDVERESIALNRDADTWLDVDAFHEQIAGCGTHSHPADEFCTSCTASLAEAAALYRDDFLAGFTLRDSPEYDDWQFFQTQGLRDEYAGALERLVYGYAARDELDPAIEYARRWLALDPLHESAHRCLMELYARAGQRAAALRQYAECERVLQEELAVPPAEVTVQLYHAIREQRGAPGSAERLLSPAEAQPEIRVRNLPTQLVPFVGRESALKDIGDLLEDPSCRLLTLFGPGGSGKTRLALEAASVHSQHFRDGVDFVPLAPLDAPEAIAPAIAEALSFSFYEGSDAQQQLLDYLSNKHKLLILDNYDHLLEGAGVVTEILRSASEAKIVVTSRAKLSVQGEHVYPVSGMDLPQDAGHLHPATASPHPRRTEEIARFDAIRLFLSGAHRAQPGFEATEDVLADIAHICHQVEGLPLAILLAASWVGMLTPAEIVSEIERSLDFLESDLRDIPERQRSLRAVFDYSWGLLSERERQVFQALSVFRASFARSAAERVAGASLRELMALASKSLLHRSAAGRYEVHGLLRQYAEDQLAASPSFAGEARDRHCAFYATAVQRWDAELRGSRQLVALAEIEADLGNVRAAWEWAVERRYIARLDQAVDGLCRFYEWRGRLQEGEAACRAALSALCPLDQETEASRARPSDSGSSVQGSPDGEPRQDARSLRTLVVTLAWHSYFGQALGHTERAKQLLQQALAHLSSPTLAGQDTRQEQAFVLWQMGHTAYLSDREDARAFYEHSLALYREMGDLWGTAAVLHDLGDLIEGSGAFDEAEVLVRESLEIRQILGDRRGIACSLRILGVIAQFRGRLKESERLTRESLDAFQAIDDQVRTAEAFINLGGALLLLGDLVQARAYLERSVAIGTDLGPSSSLTSLALANLGLADLLLGETAQAGTRGQQSLTIARETGYQNGIAKALWMLGLVAVADREYAQGQQLLLESISIFQELEHSDVHGVRASLGYTAPALGQASLARKHLSRALQAASEIGMVIPLILALPAVALLLADRGQVEDAVAIYALALRYPTVANSRWFEYVAGRHLTAAASALPPEVVAAAQERGRSCTVEATVAEILQAWAEVSTNS
jgi:predicted ATPase